jgi:hypothetical protein
MDSKSIALGQAKHIGLEEMLTLDLQMLHDISQPTLVVLYENLRKMRLLRTHTVLLDEMVRGGAPRALSAVMGGMYMWCHQFV